MEAAPSGRGGVAAGGTSPGVEGVASSKWARDEEITSKIKSVHRYLWCGLYSASVCRGLATWIKVRQSKGEDDRLQTVYSKESELLTKQLSEPLRRQNVILNHESLRLLAILHESLVCIFALVGVILFPVGVV